MKYSPTYEDLLGYSNEDEVFEYLMSTLTPSVKRWDYFIDWQKALGNTRDIEVHLNTLNYLVGKEDPETELRYLLEENPKLMEALPALLAVRHNEVQVLTKFDEGVIQHREFKFNGITAYNEEHIDDAIFFARESGILDLFEENRIKNVVDYVFGVEVGIDTNGRKNRGGKAMENALLEVLGPLCEDKGYKLMEQATAKKLDKQWDIDLTVDKTRRRIDFAILANGDLFLIETNFYNSGGSKLKSTAGEYQALDRIFRSDGHEFVWITDGFGWNTTRAPLRETFDHIDYVLNLKMVSEGVLEAILDGAI